MSLMDLVNDTIKVAMKAQDTDKLRAYRSIKAAFLVLNTAGGTSLPTEDDYAKAIVKMAKQRKDSIAIFEEQGRNDLADIEKIELNFIDALLPKQLSEGEMKVEIQQIIEEIQAVGIKDMGKVMGMAQKKLGSSADGKILSNLVKELLA